MIDKKGQLMPVVILIGVIFVLVLVGFITIIGSSVFNFVADETVPILKELGQVGSWNASQTMDIVITPVNTFIQNMTWVSGVVYVLGLMGVFGLAFAFRLTGDKWLIGFFVSMVLILIIACIIMSNIYEEFYEGTDDFAVIMQEHVLLSYMILYSPMIMSIVAFIAGIIMFSGPSEGLI